MSKLSHKQLESFVTDTLSKREPCPAMVLAWGWLLKQVCSNARIAPPAWMRQSGRRPAGARRPRYTVRDTAPWPAVGRRGLRRLGRRRVAFGGVGFAAVHCRSLAGHRTAGLQLVLPLAVLPTWRAEGMTIGAGGTGWRALQLFPASIAPCSRRQPAACCVAGNAHTGAPPAAILCVQLRSACSCRCRGCRPRWDGSLPVLTTQPQASRAVRAPLAPAARVVTYLHWISGLPSSTPRCTPVFTHPTPSHPTLYSHPAAAAATAPTCLGLQGEGGFFHGDSFKQRFFVLARVPHSTVLIYYGERTMDEENILGEWWSCGRGEHSR